MVVQCENWEEAAAEKAGTGRGFQSARMDVVQKPEKNAGKPVSISILNEAA